MAAKKPRGGGRGQAPFMGGLRRGETLPPPPTSPRNRPTLPAQASPTARAAVAKTRPARPAPGPIPSPKRPVGAGQMRPDEMPTIGGGLGMAPPPGMMPPGTPPMPVRPARKRVVQPALQKPRQAKGQALAKSAAPKGKRKQ